MSWKFLTVRTPTNDYKRICAYDPPEAWKALVYNTGWSDYGSGEAPGSYRTTPDGEVVLRGLTKRPAAGSSTIATLPLLYRPEYTEEFAVGAGMGGAPYYSAARITVLSDGQIILREGDPSAFLILRNVRFDAKR